MFADKCLLTSWTIENILLKFLLNFFLSSLRRYCEDEPLVYVYRNEVSVADSGGRAPALQPQGKRSVVVENRALSFERIGSWQTRKYFPQMYLRVPIWPDPLTRGLNNRYSE